MSDWKIIIPEGTTNLYPNPSFEHATWNTGGWIDTGTNPPVSASDIANQKWGRRSAQVTFGGPNSVFAVDFVGIKAALDLQQQTLSAYVRTVAANVRLIFQSDFTDIGTQYSAFHPGDGRWHRLSMTYTPDFDSGGATTFILCGVTCDINGIVAYVDAFQLELKGEETTYCDGDQPGCEWLGVPHNSSSQRSAVSRAALRRPARRGRFLRREGRIP